MCSHIFPSRKAGISDLDYLDPKVADFGVAKLMAKDEFAERQKERLPGREWA